MPMFLQGMHGMHRRWYDGGATYTQLSEGLLHWNGFMSTSAFLLGAAQFIFIFNFFVSIFAGKKCGRNPWHATTVDWDTPSPPGHGNFDKAIAVYRGPYEYSVPGAPEDYTPQTQPTAATQPHTLGGGPELAPAH
jgi:cytochrome c oxidase subunit 1